MGRDLKLVDINVWKAATDRSNLALVKATVDDVPPEAASISDLRQASERSGQDFSQAERTITWTISTEARDRDGDRIRASGYELKHYKRNPVVLWAHKHDEPPIGKTLDVWVDSYRSKPRLRALKQFTAQDENAFGHMIYKLALGKYIRAASVGFRPVDFDIDPEAKDSDGNGIFPPMLFDRVELLESSIVPVPSNPEALLEAKSVGIDIVPMIGWCEKILDEQGSTVLRKTAEGIWTVTAGTKSYSFAPSIAPNDGAKTYLSSNSADVVAPQEKGIAPMTETKITKGQYDELVELIRSTIEQWAIKDDSEPYMDEEDEEEKTVKGPEDEEDEEEDEDLMELSIDSQDVIEEGVNSDALVDAVSALFGAGKGAK